MDLLLAAVIYSITVTTGLSCLVVSPSPPRPWVRRLIERFRRR